MKKVLAFLLGFVAYPALFVPMMNLWFPRALDVWVQWYAEYLRVWGF